MSEVLEKYLTISQFAKIYNINKKTLIYYDEIDLFKPALIKDNGYRFYTFYQTAIFEVILVLKQFGMPLKEIKAYLDKRSIDELYSILKKHKNIIENQIKELNRLNSIINNKINIIEEHKHIDKNFISIEDMEEEYFVISKNIKNINERTFITNMSEHIANSYNNKIYKGYGIGIMINVLELFNNNFTNYSYFYIKLDKKTKNKNFYIKEKGKYLVAYYKGHWNTFPIFYKEILTYAKENNLKLYGYCYEQTIFDESSEKTFETYLTKFMIKVN